MKRIEPLDYARFIAAICVILFHYTLNGIANGKISSITNIPYLIDYTKYGYLGVEFFFMISGYVIFYSANNKTPGQFATSRAVRLYPAFWCAVIFTSIVAQFWGGQKMSVSFTQMIANLTMVPNVFGYNYVDGVYWTLFFELKFYFAILILLIVGLQRSLKVFLLFWPIAMLLALVTKTQWLPFMGGYYAFFAAGSIFAIYKERPAKIIVIPLLICLYLCVQFSMAKAPELSEIQGLKYYPSTIGIIIFSQFLFFIFINSNYGSNLKLPASRLAGGLTYPIYLIHAHFGYMFISRYATNSNRYIIYATTILIVFVVSYLIHKLIEKRLAKEWHMIFMNSIGKPVDRLQSQVGKFIRRYNRSTNELRQGK